MPPPPVHRLPDSDADHHHSARDTDAEHLTYNQYQQQHTHTHLQQPHTVYDKDPEYSLLPILSSPLPPVAEFDVADPSSVPSAGSYVAIDSTEPHTETGDYTQSQVDHAQQQQTDEFNGTDNAVSATTDKTALVRAIMVTRADAAIEVGEMAEVTMQDANQVVAPITFESPDGINAVAAPTERPKLSISNLISTYIPVRILGITYLAVSAAIFSIQALFVSVISSEMPSMQIVWFRCLLQFSFGWLACQYTGVNFLGPPPKRKWIFIRGLVGVVSFSLYYYAISHLTLADSTSIFFTAPLYTGIMGRLFLGEPMARFDAACTLASVLGVVLIVRPPFLGFATTEASDDDATDPNANTGAYRTMGVLAAICGAWFSAFVYIAIRKVGKGVPPLVLVCAMGGVGVFVAPFGGIFQTFHWPASFGTWVMVLLIGFFSFCGQILFNAGVQLEKAGPASMIRNLDVAFSFLWQMVVEGISPNGWSVIGAMVISASVVAMGVKKWRQESAAAAAATTAPSPNPTTGDAAQNGIEFTSVSQDGSSSPIDTVLEVGSQSISSPSGSVVRYSRWHA